MVAGDLFHADPGDYRVAGDGVRRKPVATAVTNAFGGTTVVSNSYEPISR